MNKLPIPRTALDMSLIMLAKTRAGKSSTLRTLIEVLDADGERNCIITPKDDWWGLKLGADGKSPGRPFVIFGGEYADVPINGRAGKDIGELVATGKRPCIITLSELSIADRTRFMIDFAETLYKQNRGKIFLTVDECHNFAPKGKLFDPQQAQMLHWMNRLASEGLGRGIILLSASQRPQKVHNDYLTSHELLVAKKVNHGADRGAIRDWAEGSGDKAVVNKLVDSLAGLARSDAWVWCPEIGLGPKLVTFPFFETYDSFKPQPVGERKLKGWASVDLKDVEAKLSAVVKEARENDPKALHARIRELEGQVKAKVVLASAPPDSAAPSRFLRDTDFLRQLHGRNALPGRDEQVHRIQPLVQGNMRPLKDGAGADREVLFALIAAVIPAPEPGRPRSNQHGDRIQAFDARPVHPISVRTRTRDIDSRRRAGVQQSVRSGRILMADWSDQRLKQLTNLVKDGATASQISDAIGISRNAVIGKINRLGLRLHGRSVRSPIPHKAKAVPPEHRPVAPLTPPTDAEIYRSYANQIFMAARQAICWRKRHKPRLPEISRDIVGHRETAKPSGRS